MTNGSGFTAGIRKLALTAAIALASGTAPMSASAQNEKPQYGGTLSLGMVYVTLSPLSWDPTDWPWKYAQDAGLMHESVLPLPPSARTAESTSAIDWLMSTTPIPSWPVTRESSRAISTAL